MKLPTFFNLLLLILLLCHYSDGGRKVIKSPRRPGKGNYVLRKFVGISKIFWNKKVQGNREIQKLKPKKNISTLLESLRQGNKCGDKCLRKDRAILNEVDSAIGERLRTDRKGRRFRRSNSSVSCHMVFDRMRKKLFSGFIKTWMNWFSNGDNKFFRQNSYLAVDYKDGNCSRQLLGESGRTNKKKPRKRRRKKRALTLVDRTATANGHPGFGGIGARRRGRRSWSQRPRQPRLTGEGPSPYHWNDFRTAIRRRRDNNSQWQYQNRIRSASVKAAGGDIDVENESSFDNKVTNHVNPDGTRQFDRHTTASSKFKYSGDPVPGFSPSAMQFGGSNTFSGGGGNRVGTRGNMRVRFADQGPFHNYSVEHGHQFNMRNGMGSGGGIGGRPRGILKPSLRPNPVATFSLYQHQLQRRRPQQRRSNYVPSMPRPTAAGGYHGGYQGSYSAGGGQRSNYRSSFHHAHGPGGSDFEDYDDYSDSDGDEEDDDDDEDDEGEGYYAEGGHGMSYRGHHSNHMVVVHHGLRGMMRPAPAPHKSNTSKIVATVVVVFFILLCLL